MPAISRRNSASSVKSPKLNATLSATTVAEVRIPLILDSVL
jgi:hypothetical protein